MLSFMHSFDIPENIQEIHTTLYNKQDLLILSYLSDYWKINKSR